MYVYRHLAAPAVKATPPSMEEVVEMLRNVGFDDERQKNQVGSLSGGWKMKLALGEQ